MRMSRRDKAIEGVSAAVFAGLSVFAGTWIVEDCILSERENIYIVADWNRFHPDIMDPRIKEGMIWGGIGMVVGGVGRITYDEIRERRDKKK